MCAELFLKQYKYLIKKRKKVSFNPFIILRVKKINSFYFFSNFEKKFNYNFALILSLNIIQSNRNA